DGRYASYAPSTDSLIQLLEQKKKYRPTGSVTSFSRSASWVSNGGNLPMGEFPNPDEFLNSDAPYPAWSDPNQIPLSKEEIEDIFKSLTAKLGFQYDNMRNMYDAMMTMLDSRASRMSPSMALLMLHADYIGGDHANYRRWYFSAQLDHDTPPVREQVDQKTQQEMLSEEVPSGKADTPAAFVEKWRAKMNSLSQYERARHIALWMLLWGEAGNIRFIPELLCFLFKLADDYVQSPLAQQRVEPAPEGEYLTNVITPLYNYIRDQGYEVINGKYVKRERDHASTIGYDDINECFWTPEGLRLI
ncbi:1,3-beta-D-glucan synthase, partial [Spiromyces aspiralis]